MKRFNHILLLATAVLATAGCDTSKLSTNEFSREERAISYNSTVQKTRAAQMGTTELKEYGWMNIAAFLSDGDNTHYYTDDLRFNGSRWTSPSSRYWPIEHNLNMLAYSPLKDFIIIENETNYSNYTLRYSTPTDINDQVDLVAQSVKNQSPEVNKGIVDLDFQHILSAIKFNIEIEGESNVTLNSIALNYVGIERERSFSFGTMTWNTSEQIYFDKKSGLSTTIDVNKNAISSNGGSVVFNDIDNHLMIIPQKISHLESDPHYISIQVRYSLIGAQDSNEIAVSTGVMPLPAPKGSNEYKQGESYTYNVVINGETISFNDLSINDQNDPTPAYGNINLGLITTMMKAEEIGYSDAIDDDAQFYYTTALRTKNLLADGVRDFVVVGSMGASNESGGNTLGNGKLGYYGSESSPFYIGAKLANLGFGAEDLFSIDLRGTYDYPRFADANHDDHRVSSKSDDLIGDNEPILIAGLFANIDWLDEVILPHGVAAIGNHAFDSCESLRHIDLADVRHIEIGAFQNCKALEIVDNGALTRIHANGFDNCTSLTTIDLKSVTEVEELAFVNCENLTEVNLTLLDHIGKHAFNGCSNLTLVKGTVIPGFTMVEDYAFSGCYRLGENGGKIDLTEATKVGDHAFASCEHIQLSSGDLMKLSIVGDYALSGCLLLGKNREFKIPALESVGVAGFANSPKVNIVEGLENLKIISYYAFQNCTSLTGYSADSETKILSLPKVTSVDGFGLSNTAITNVSFSDKLTSVGVYGFNDCKELTTLSGIENVTSVGLYAFSGCSSLEELNLQKLTSDNCSGAFFYGCNSLKKISLPLLTKNDVSWVDEEGDLHESTILGMISADFKAIESIDLSSLVTEIPKWHITDKLHLEYANFASATAVGEGGFAGCSALKSLDLRSAKTIGSHALDGCTSLETLILSSLEGSFGGWQYFQKQTKLKYIDLGSITSIAEMTFQDNKAIESLDLRSTISVGQMTFQNCTALTKLNLSSLETIGENAFSGIPNLQCEIWLSDELAAEADGTTWQGVEWKAIYTSSNKEFN